jgi:hypothetical protein
MPHYLASDPTGIFGNDVPRQRMLIEITQSIAEIGNEKHQAAMGRLLRALAST